MTKTLDHRALLTRGFAGSALVAGGTIGLPRIAFAAAPGEKNLLFVLLRGAADGLAMVAPVGDPGFAKLRERSLPDYEGALTTGGMFAIHPALGEVGKAYGQGDALFVHATATHYRERSHFDGQNMLETGAPKPYGKSDGWLNRLVGLMSDAAGGSAPKALAIASTKP